MKTKEERKERRQRAVAKLQRIVCPDIDHALRAPDAEDIAAAVAFSSAIGAWALSRFDPAMLPALNEAWEALQEERADTPDDLAGLAAREQ